LQPLEPLLGSTPQIKLSDLEKFVSIEITHFGRHRETLRPIIDVLMIPSPKQFIHALGISHLSKFQQQQKQDATLLTTHKPSKHKNKIDQPLGSCSDSNF